MSTIKTETEFIKKNKEIEERWRKGLISNQAFDWWLRFICGI